MTTHRRQRAWLRLALCHSVGPVTWNRWLAELAREGVAFEDFLEMAEYVARPYVKSRPEIERALRREGPSGERFDRVLRRFEDQGIRIIPIDDPHYPQRLLRDLGMAAPAFLCVAGNLGHLRSATVGIVGTRRPSAEGEATARAYGAALAREGIHVVSGNAGGIDTAAHAGALEGGGSTTLVLPQGILAYRPSAALRDNSTRDNTLVVSEFPPDLTGGRDLPVRRNTTIASLADGLVVIETGLVSGTSYTFREARRLRKPRWTVIYTDPVPPSAGGNHSLISAGAKPLEPGAEGAGRCAAEVARRLRESHSENHERVEWPPEESLGQMDLF